MTQATASRPARNPLGLLRLVSIPLALSMAGAAWADSTSSAASSVSTSVGSASESLGRSSNSSSKGAGVAQGPYTVDAMLAVAGRPDLIQLQLRAAGSPAAPDAFWVRLPRTTAMQAQLAVGAQLLALLRPYGLALARPDAHEPFYLVLDDAIHHELGSHPVGG